MRVANRTAHGIAFLHLRIAALQHRAFFLFGHGAAIHHHVFFGHVEFDDAAEDLLLDHLLHFGGVSRSAARGGHEGAHSYVHAEAAFDHACHRAHDSRLVRESFLQGRPVFWPLDFGAGELVVAFRIAALDRDRQLVAGLHRFASGLQRRQREDALTLETDVEEDRVAGNNNHSTDELFAAVFALARMALFVLRQHVAERFIGFCGGFSSEFGFRNAWVGHDRVGTSLKEMAGALVGFRIPQNWAALLRNW